MAPGPRSFPQRVSHEIRTIHAALQAGSTKVERPNHRHPVREHQVEPGQDPGEFGVVPGLAKNVGVGWADSRGPRFTGGGLDPLRRGIGLRGETDTYRISTYKCHGVNTLVSAVGANSRYWGQGQQITASLTPGL